MPNPGNFQVANYETPQPAKLAYEETPYCWIVQTQSVTASDTSGHHIRADLLGRKGRRRHRHAYYHGASYGENHTEAALAFMRAHVLPENSHARLVSMASNDQGFCFVFV